MSHLKQDEKHWLAIYGDLAVRYLENPDSLSPDERKQYGELDFRSREKEDQSQLLEEAAVALVECLTPAAQPPMVLPAGGGAAVDGIANWAANTYSVAAKSDFAGDNFLNILARAGGHEVRLQDIDPAFSRTDTIFKIDNNWAVLQVPEHCEVVLIDNGNSRRLASGQDFRRLECDKLTIGMTETEAGIRIEICRAG